jgi:hypothetical protein
MMEQIEVDDVVALLQRRVAARRASGDYPPGLEEQLEAEYAVIMAGMHRGELTTEELGRRVAAVEHTAAAVRALDDTGSRVPGGSVVHTAASRVVARHTNQLADSLRQLGIDVARALHEIHHLIDEQRHADERQLSEVISSVLDRLAVVDHLADAVLQIERRLDLLESRDHATS